MYTHIYTRYAAVAEKLHNLESVGGGDIGMSAAQNIFRAHRVTRMAGSGAIAADCWMHTLLYPVVQSPGQKHHMSVYLNLYRTSNMDGLTSHAACLPRPLQ